MKNLNMRPLPTKSLKENASKPWKKWLLVLVLATILIGYLIWKVALSNTNQPFPVTKQIEATQPVSTPLDSAASDSGNETPEVEDSSDASSLNGDVLTPETILNAPLPESDSLAKEEIDRLDDELKRLTEQEKLAAEQLAMNKQLAEMKEEQIALVEQQLAQLEAGDTVKTATE